jgi:hypothetical protein
MSARLIAYDNNTRTRYDRVCRTLDVAKAAAIEWKAARRNPGAVECRIISRSNVIWKTKCWRGTDVWVAAKE